MVKVCNSDASQIGLALGTRFALSLALDDKKGRCLIAKEDIPVGETIEVSPAIVMERTDCEAIDQTSITNYYFNLGRTESDDDLSYMKGGIPLGLMSLCNHANTPNAECFVMLGDLGYLFYLRSVREIKSGDEVCIKYRELWFDDV